jgi:hypothetical protein
MRIGSGKCKLPSSTRGASAQKLASYNSTLHFRALTESSSSSPQPFLAPLNVKGSLTSPALPCPPLATPQPIPLEDETTADETTGQMEDVAIEGVGTAPRRDRSNSSGTY